MDNIRTNIWKLFREEFKDGEKVIVVHEDTNIYWGTLRATERECCVGSRDFTWDQIVFIAHDGFPCRVLHTCLSDEQLDEVENDASIIVMRKLLTQKPKEKLITEKTPARERKTYSSGGFGCPYQIEEMEMQIINPLNRNWDYQEMLLCKSKDGAIGMLWDIDNEIIEFYN